MAKKFKNSDLYKYAKNKLMEKIIENGRGVKKCNDGVNRLDKEDQRQNFGILLGFKENEYSIIKKIKKIFENQIINEQYRVKN